MAGWGDAAQPATGARFVLSGANAGMPDVAVAK